MAEQLLNPIERTGSRLGVGRTTVYELIATGKLRAVKIGGRRLVPESALVEYVQRLEAEQCPPAA